MLKTGVELHDATVPADQQRHFKDTLIRCQWQSHNDGTRTFEWDARNQIVAVTVETHRSEFTYDGLQRRVREIEKENNVVQSDTRLLWCGTEICEERAANGFTVTRRAFRQGEEIGGVISTSHLIISLAFTP